MADERGAFLDIGDFSRESEENNAGLKTDKSRVLSQRCWFKGEVPGCMDEENGAKCQEANDLQE